MMPVLIKVCWAGCGPSWRGGPGLKPVVRTGGGRTGRPGGGERKEKVVQPTWQVGGKRNLLGSTDKQAIMESCKISGTGLQPAAGSGGAANWSSPVPQQPYCKPQAAHNCIIHKPPPSNQPPVQKLTANDKCTTCKYSILSHMGYIRA